MMNTEKMFYNAVAIALEGDPWRVKKLRARCGDLFAPWQTAYEILMNDASAQALGVQSDGLSPPDLREPPRQFIPPDPGKAWQELERLGIRLILLGDDDYPPLLREIHDPPQGIYVLGELPPTESAPNNHKNNLFSIVGTRRATPEGKTVTKRFARELASAKFVIVSGLALGIDAAAHEGCLEAAATGEAITGDGAGKTIAVLAGGLDDVYPSTNARLAKKILERGGALVSEYPLREPPYDYRFLERNRIVSGLSKGVLVVECPQRSGALVTARLSLEENRDVFVVPGNISHPNFFGSHSLIRQGATLVTKPEDILEAYGMLASDRIAAEEMAASVEEKLVLIALRAISKPLDVDKIISMTKLEPRAVNQALSLMIMKRLVKETEMGYIIE